MFKTNETNYTKIPKVKNREHITGTEGAALKIAQDVIQLVINSLPLFGSRTNNRVGVFV